jgi:hypothetical protein
MPSTITCTRCGHEQVVEDLAGADVLCRGYRHPIQRAQTAIQLGPGPVQLASPEPAEGPLAPAAANRPRPCPG